MAELTASTGHANGKVRRNRMSTRIDLTAMVDLAFLLITFFILTTTLSKPKAFNFVMPDDTPTKDPTILPASRTMTIVLGKDNKAVSYLGMTEKPFSTPQVTNFNTTDLRQIMMETSKRITATTGKNMFTIIKASDHSVYNNLINAIDELHIAGASGYAIVDITPKEVALLKQKGVY